jgi:hypothetical protein
MDTNESLRILTIESLSRRIQANSVDALSLLGSPFLQSR